MDGNKIADNNISQIFSVIAGVDGRVRLVKRPTPNLRTQIRAIPAREEDTRGK